MDRDNLKSAEELTFFFQQKFVRPIYSIKRGKDNLEIRSGEHIYDQLSLREEPFVDRDGTFLGGINWRVNFFVFNRDPKTLVPPQWALDSVRSWCAYQWRFMPKRPFLSEKKEQTIRNDDLGRRIWRYMPDDYVQWLIKNYPDVSVWDDDGDKIKADPPGTIVG